MLITPDMIPRIIFLAVVTTLILLPYIFKKRILSKFAYNILPKEDD